MSVYLFPEARARSESVLCDPRLNRDLARKAYAILSDVNAKSDGTWWVAAFEGKRSLARQLQLFRKGASKLKHGKHCLGRAVDFVFWVKGQGWSWDGRLPWRLVGSSARAHGLVWGGDWKRFVDRPHVEM